MTKKEKNRRKKTVLIIVLSVVLVIAFFVLASIGEAKEQLRKLANYDDRKEGRKRGIKSLKSHLMYAKNNPEAVTPGRLSFSRKIFYNPYLAWIQGKVTRTY